MNKNYLTLAKSKLPNSAIEWLTLSLIISPVFVMAIHGWMTRILLFSSILSCYILVSEKTKKTSMSANRKWMFLLTTALALPIVAIFLGQLFRHEFYLPNYDSPFHIFGCIPILMVMIKHKINIGKSFAYTLPITILITAIITMLYPSIVWMTEGKLTIEWVNPITFGYLCITLSMLCFISIDFSKDSSKILMLVQFIAVFIGAYMSMLSLSRSGWISAPIVIFLWLLNSNFKHKRGIATMVVMTVIISSISIYHLAPQIKDRIDSATSEIQNYQWNGVNYNTSVGDRISFARMALFLLKERPLGGWGDQGFADQLNRPELNFTVMQVKEIALWEGFHNTISASAVKSGIWGLLSIITIFLIPALISIKGLGSGSLDIRHIALINMSFVVCVFISGMTMEVFDLKYTASFYAMIMTILSGSLLVSMDCKKIQC